MTKRLLLVVLSLLFIFSCTLSGCKKRVRNSPESVSDTETSATQTISDGECDFSSRDADTSQNGDGQAESEADSSSVGEQPADSGEESGYQESAAGQSDSHTEEGSASQSTCQSVSQQSSQSSSKPDDGWTDFY